MSAQQTTARDTSRAGGISDQYQRPHYAPGVPAVIAPVAEPLSCMLDDAVRRLSNFILKKFLLFPFFF